MERKGDCNFHDSSSYEHYLDRLASALEPFAEEPTEEMNDYPCHVGICSKEQCSRCSKAVEAWKALRDIE